LIELMIVVAVIGLLAAIALPSYQNSVRKSRRADAKSALLDLASREERYFSINNQYTNDPTKLGYGASSTFPLAVSASSQSYYSLSKPTVTTGTATVAPAFTAQATPTGAQTADTTCYTYQIDQLGTQTNLDASSNSLSSAGCW
jgi:type IV pilus assembly protein PilE